MIYRNILKHTGIAIGDPKEDTKDERKNMVGKEGKWGNIKEKENN